MAGAGEVRLDEAARPNIRLSIHMIHLLGPILQLSTHGVVMVQADVSLQLQVAAYVPLLQYPVPYLPKQQRLKHLLKTKI